MITVQNLLKVKGNAVWSVTPESSVSTALKTMAEKDIGALVVMEGETLAGIISERDFVRSISSTGQCSLDSPVKNYMTRDVITISSDFTIENCMKLMTDKHIRHLPVLDESRLVGMISIGDVVREIISSHESTIVQLENFIEGRGYAH